MQNKIESFGKLFEENLYEYFKEYLPQYKLIFESMEYSVKNGGKRVRPLLTMLFCDACGGDVSSALPFAQAVEFIHTYSLIHDDLPCMDNDDFRRGKPSNHKVYGEAFALLAGDGLLTAAFERISQGCLDGLYDSETAISGVSALSSLAGSRGMIGGQVVDLLNENKLNSKLSVGEVKLSKSEVVVKGSQDNLDKIATVKALIDLEAANLTNKGVLNDVPNTETISSFSTEYWKSHSEICF